LQLKKLKELNVNKSTGQNPVLVYKMTSKVCSVCKGEKKLDCYSKDSSRKGGYDSTCKTCKKDQDIVRQERVKVVKPTKTCSVCKETQNLDNFHKNKGNADGLHTSCKDCKRKHMIAKKKENINKVLPDDYTKTCTSCNTTKNKTEFYKNVYTIDGIGNACIICEKSRTKEWRDNNKDKVSGYRQTQYPKYLSRRKIDSQFKMSGNIRNRIRMALKRQNSPKFKNSYELIGCTPAFMKEWLGHQFDSKMTWENYGTYWSIDHVIPCNFFDLTDRDEQLECFNWRNCRPLECSKNMSKNDTIQPIQIHLQEIRVHYYERHIQIAGIS